ncbi:MAG: XRE family transcriptional regulator [Gemmatimonadaceae bacterium]|nr:XRE family transcriptional regulator [Gemmatimonadaceae bacterium]
MDIGKRIGEIRGQVGLSQSGLARAVGTSQSAISQIEAGERNPSFDMLRQIARALNVSVAHLVGGEVESLTPGELAHFRNYRGLSDEAKKELEDFAAYLRQKQSRKSAK